MPNLPTPAAARYMITGQPNPPTPITRMEELQRRDCAAQSTTCFASSGFTADALNFHRGYITMHKQRAKMLS